MRLRWVLAALLIVGCFRGQDAESGPNVLLIMMDDLRNDVGALGAVHAKTPQLDAFARTARVFTHHYVQVPTCGASRCAFLRGRYPSVVSQGDNDAIRETQHEWNSRSLPAVFRAAGYRTLSLGKVTHYPGNRTGTNWSGGAEELSGAWDRAWVPAGPWGAPKGVMHGYAGGGVRRQGTSPAWEEHEGPDEAYPDAWVAEDAVRTLRDLSEKAEPWFFSVGFFKPHLPFAAPKKWHAVHSEGVPDLKSEVRAKPTWFSGWHASSEFRRNYGHEAGADPDSDEGYARLLRRSYAACVSYVDAQVGRVLGELHRLGLERSTIVIVWSDHGFLLGEHAIWGKHCLYEAALRSPLMLRYPGMPEPGRSSGAVVESVDLFPTLTDLCGLTVPSGLDGRSLRAQLDDPTAPSSKPAYAYWRGQRTIRTERWRLIAHPAKGAGRMAVELFDYSSDPSEVRNHANARPEVVAELLARLKPLPEDRVNLRKP